MLPYISIFLYGFLERVSPARLQCFVWDVKLSQSVAQRVIGNKTAGTSMISSSPPSNNVFQELLVNCNLTQRLQTGFFTSLAKYSFKVCTNRDRYTTWNNKTVEWFFANTSVYLRGGGSLCLLDALAVTEDDQWAIGGDISAAVTIAVKQIRLYFFCFTTDGWK